MRLLADLPCMQFLHQIQRGKIQTQSKYSLLTNNFKKNTFPKKRVEAKNSVKICCLFGEIVLIKEIAANVVNMKESKLSFLR
jgi:hypothetical protein